MTVYEEKLQRVSLGALNLISADLIGRYGLKKLKVILSHARVEPRILVEKLTEAKVFEILARITKDSSISGFLELLEYITSPLLFGGNDEKANQILQQYVNLLSKENFEYKDGCWYVGPTKEEEEWAKYDLLYYYWRNSKGEELEPDITFSLPKTEVKTWITCSEDGRDFYYDNKKIEWNRNDNIYKAFNILFKSVNELGFVPYVEYEKNFKREYPIDHKKISNFRAWLLKNLTQKGEGIIKKTKDQNLIAVVRKQGIQFNNKKLP